MEKVELPIHEHPLLHFARFAEESCLGCRSFRRVYGGYRCNELGCDLAVFHKECAESLPEINHSSHPHHPLKLLLSSNSCCCSRCGGYFRNGYFCSLCNFQLDFDCARGQGPPPVLENPNAHSLTKHPLERLHMKFRGRKECQVCNSDAPSPDYKCYQCELYFHMECAKFFPEANHTSHPQHPLKFITCEAAPDYADNQCLLCGLELYGHFHHCDVCNFSICQQCMQAPPPVSVLSLTTHEHQLHLVPRRINFTCNACGTLGDRSPYFCLQCNFMIHRDCIDLPRVININRHDHRISYTRRLGHGNWKCGVCRKKVDGFYGAYSCSKCSSYVVHSRCATRSDVWDKLELEGTPEEEEIPPFEVVDDNTIKHFSHDHNLRINKDGHTLHESTICQACVFQISSETFYSCEQCDFIIHEKCANLPRKKRHVCHNQRFTLHTDPLLRSQPCHICHKLFVGFRYQHDHLVLDVRCGSIAEPFEHESHPHPLFYKSDANKSCTICGEQKRSGGFICDECVDFTLCFTCGVLPQKVMRHRYDDHPLILSYGESSVEGEYWCEACETKVNPKEWFYTCNDCGITLHISCVVGDFLYNLAGSEFWFGEGKVVLNTSICRPLCSVCKSRCKLPSILKFTKTNIVEYMCSLKCFQKARIKLF